MERVCMLQVTRGQRLLVTVRARPFGSDVWYTAEEWDVTAQLPTVFAAAQGAAPPPEPQPMAEKPQCPETRSDWVKAGERLPWVEPCKPED